MTKYFEAPVKKIIQNTDSWLPWCRQLPTYSSDRATGTPEFLSTAPKTFREFTLIPTSFRPRQTRNRGTWDAGWAIGDSFSIRSTGFHKNRWFPGEHTAVESKYTQEIQLEENGDSSLANKTLRIGGCRDLWCSIAKHHDTIWLWLTVRHGKSTHAIKSSVNHLFLWAIVITMHDYVSHNQMVGLCQCETESQSPGPEALFEALFGWLSQAPCDKW